MSLVYTKYQDINKKKWDDCIDKSVNGLIYGYSFYLDAMAENWDGIILNDYEAVLPLTWKTKWGISYLYQPPFIQQSGVFFKDTSGEISADGFLHLAFDKFKFAEITLNYANTFSTSEILRNTTTRTNFILDLSRSYKDLYENYEPSFTKSLRRIKKFGMRIKSGVNYAEHIRLYKSLYGRRLPYFKPDSYARFQKICDVMFAKQKLIIREVWSEENEMLASVIFIRDDNRLYNIISCLTAAGRTLEANYYLYDQVVQEFAGQSLLLDFEGSDVPGIAAFYKKFNPVNQPYLFVKHNNLPGILKVFKR